MEAGQVFLLLLALVAFSGFLGLSLWQVAVGLHMLVASGMRPVSDDDV